MLKYSVQQKDIHWFGQWDLLFLHNETRSTHSVRTLPWLLYFLTESPMHFNRLYWPEYMNKFKYELLLKIERISFEWVFQTNQIKCVTRIDRNHVTCHCKRIFIGEWKLGLVLHKELCLSWYFYKVMHK